MGTFWGGGECFTYFGYNNIEYPLYTWYSAQPLDTADVVCVQHVSMTSEFIEFTIYLMAEAALGQLQAICSINYGKLNVSAVKKIALGRISCDELFFMRGIFEE